MANLSIKGARDEVVERLKERAERNHRSLNGELLAIIEAAIEARPLSIDDAVAEIRKLGIKGPSELAAIVRAARDARYSR